LYHEKDLNFMHCKQMKTIVQAKITINGKHLGFDLFDWQWPDAKPARS